ncbi:TPA: DUF2971 domain-containing protein [Enterococcus faecalis]|nr:DUF2971 domain-containing protein [Enterococcus faecalis]
MTPYLLENLEKNQVTAISPIHFNDSFDSLMITNTKDTIIEQYNERVLLAQKVNQVWPISKNNFIESMENQIVVSKTFAQKELMICCFTENADSSYMWGHYGNNAGVCLEYSTKMRSFDFIYPVAYGTTPISVTELVDPVTDENIEIAVLLSALYKDIEWSPEKEWRIILPNLKPNSYEKEDGFMPVIVNTPNEITLGTKFFNDIFDGQTINEYKYKLLRITKKHEIRVSILRYINIREPNKTIINTSDLISTFDKFRNKQLSSYQLEEILERIIRN